MNAKKEDLLIVPLGGLEQVGANCTMIGNNKEWIMIDLGIIFYDKLGIEVLTPDISFPESVKDSIKGLFITHAHEDHIGAIQYLWPKLRCPIYLTEFPAAILKQKLKEYSWGDEVEINVVKPNQKIKTGSFEVEFVSLSHSILGACGIYVKTQAGSIFHTGDWKIDETPLLGDSVDEERLKEIGKEGVDCLLCDSTNVLTEEQIGSETTVKDALLRIIPKYKNKRITVTCFSSNVARLESIFSIAKKLGRRVAIIGRSMHKMLNAVSETSYFSKQFKNNVNSILTDEEVASMPPEKVLMICTGSQGESRSALFRLARGENRVIKIDENDVVLFSSKVIPGNELRIREMQNLLIKKGVEIITTDMEDDIHVSGHPNKESIEKMYKWLKPRSLMPIHGDAMMLFAHRDFALKCGIPEVFIAESGDVVNFKGGKLQKIRHIDIVFNVLDGDDLIPIDSKVIYERTVMTYNGHMSVSFVISDEEGVLVGSPDVVIDGIYLDDSAKEKLDSVIYQIISTELMKTSDIVKLKLNCKNSLRKLITRHFQKKPVVTIHLHRI